MDADHGDSQQAGEQEENTAEMHTRLAVEIPLQDIKIIMRSGDFVCGEPGAPQPLVGIPTTLPQMHIKHLCHESRMHIQRLHRIIRFH